jgi:hypothetical protein
LLIRNGALFQANGASFAVCVQSNTQICRVRDAGAAATPFATLSGFLGNRGDGEKVASGYC